MFTPGLTRVIWAVVLATSLSACGAGTIEGTYVGQGDTIIDSMTFKPDAKVDIELVGVTHEGAYEIDGDSVTVVAPNGTRTPLTVASNGCLQGSGLVGTYCKQGRSASAPSSATSNSGLSQIYETRTGEGLITLEFGAARNVKVTMKPSSPSEIPDRMSFEVPYETRGDEVTISLPGNERLQLTRAGNDLEGTMNGETVRFVRR